MACNEKEARFFQFAIVVWNIQKKRDNYIKELSEDRNLAKMNLPYSILLLIYIYILVLFNAFPTSQDQKPSLL